MRYFFTAEEAALPPPACSGAPRPAEQSREKPSPPGPGQPQQRGRARPGGRSKTVLLVFICHCHSLLSSLVKDIGQSLQWEDRQPDLPVCRNKSRRTTTTTTRRSRGARWAPSWRTLRGPPAPSPPAPPPTAAPSSDLRRRPLITSTSKNQSKLQFLQGPYHFIRKGKGGSRCRRKERIRMSCS